MHVSVHPGTSWTGFDIVTLKKALKNPSVIIKDLGFSMLHQILCYKGRCNVDYFSFIHHFNWKSGLVELGQSTALVLSEICGAAD